MLNIRQYIKIFISSCLYYSGVLQQCNKYLMKHKAIIMAYHRIIPDSMLNPMTQMQGMYVSEQSFDMHMQWLLRNFDMVKVEDIIYRINNAKKWDRPLCAITFDDGWKDNYEYALPILKKYNIPATVFIVGSNLDEFKPVCWYIIFEVVIQSGNLKNLIVDNLAIDNFIEKSYSIHTVERARKLIKLLRELPYYEFIRVCDIFNKYFINHFNFDNFRNKYETLSLKDVQEMSKYGIDFGYHTLNHYMLTKIAPEKLNDELIVPENIKKDKLINFVPIFCYPDGKYNRVVIDMLRRNNYIGAVSLRQGVNDINTDCFEMFRINVHDGIAKPFPLFLLNIIGANIYK